MNALDKIVKMYRNSEESNYMRLGQWFYFKFGIKGFIYSETGADLFFIEDTTGCIQVIEKWLTDHHYFDTIPVIRN